MSRTTEIMEHIRQQVSSRAFAAGERLPSIRRLAEKMQVSPSTIVEAYDRLVAEGMIYAKRGAGFYVTNRPMPFALKETLSTIEREIDPLWVSRQSLDAHDEALKPGCGWLPAERMPLEILRRAIRQASRAEDILLTDYGRAKGQNDMRRFISRQLAEQDIVASPDQILLTNSGSNAIDLIFRLLLKPGDTVLVDDPCYFNFRALCRVHKVNVVGVPYNIDGPDTGWLEDMAIQHRPRLYLTNSALHNPTGATISPRVAHRLLTLAAAYDLIVVEDNIFSEFEPEPSPRLAALDGLERVIQIGSFSKTLSASIRCGYIVAGSEWIEALTDMQVASNFGGPSPLAAKILQLALSDGGYRKHMTDLRSYLTRQRRDAASRLADLGIEPWVMPRGGFYLWCKLPNDIDAARVARVALTENVVFAPGNVFSPAQQKTSFMRFNVSQMKYPEIYEVLRRSLLPGE